MAKMASRRQPYQHLNDPIVTTLPDSGTPTEDGGIEIVVDYDDTQIEPPIVEQASQSPPEAEPVQTRSQPERPPFEQRQELPQESDEDRATRLLRAQIERMEEDNRLLRERRDAAEQSRTAAEERAQKAETERLTAEIRDIERGLELAQERLKAAEIALAEHLENGEYKRAAEANAALFKAQYEIGRFEEAKAFLEERKQREAEASVRRQQEPAKEIQPQTEGERIEAFINQHSEAKRNYFRKHYDDIFSGGNFNKKYNRLASAHYAALEEGIPEDSEAYLKFLDRHMGYEKPISVPTPPTVPVEAFNRQTMEPKVNGAAAPESQQQPQRQPAKAQIPPAAPVSRDGVGSSGGKTVYRLTKEQYDFLKANPDIDPKEYARNYAKIARGEDGLRFMERQ